MYSSNQTKEKRARDAGLRDGVTALIASSDNRDLTIKSLMEKPLREPSTPGRPHTQRTADYPKHPLVTSSPVS